jgi:hypothetical protein
LAGGATGVSTFNTGVGFFNFDNPGTTGDDQALYDDLIDVGGVGSNVLITVNGLAPTTYNIFTYAFAPDSDTFRTDVSVNGLPIQSIGGLWPGTSTLGTTFAMHTVTLGAGESLLISATTNTGFGSVNGIQIVPIPEPTSLALLGIPALVGMARRRKRV